ncbi:hypothetical protein Ctob_016458 [Chrysochromulina tobinii]|jgi:hypothetical protein|uniref:Uncharacterized protein n=1 Tax=Chrysochromulina tobinii TaxID=1460289 RepID=A0A0M0LQ28_9EUKA|nr:hypothetical protein Ctob_016458 [Chrysochromulina tobinii]|eukprot:KOO52843.1 hypothetical protein Ctob_016458 [Chrysochromulina sp. CCMP291]
MTVRKRARAAKNLATKNRRIKGAHRSEHARAHFQNGVVDKAPLKKMKGKVEPGKRVIAEWPLIKGAPLCVTRNAAGNPYYYIDEKAINKFSLAQSYTPRTSTGAPNEGAIKLKEMLGAEGKLICCKTGRALGYVSRSGVPYGVSSFQLDHIDPKRPTMSQGRSFQDYMDAYEQGQIEIKCYEYIGLQYNLQGLQHVGNCRKYAAP